MKVRRLLTGFFFCQLYQQGIFSHHILVALRAVNNGAVAAILNPRLRVFEAAPAAISKCVKRTIAEQTVELLRIFNLVTREKFTVLMAEKLVVFLFLLLTHRITSLELSRRISIDLGIILSIGAKVSSQYIVKGSICSCHISSYPADRQS